MKQEYYPYRGNKTTACIAYAFPPTLVSKTNNITDAIGHVGDTATRRSMAKEALLRGPGCILSHMVVAKHAETIEERLFHLEMARDAGLELWTPVAHALGSRMAWWHIEDTKPFLHALNALGEAYEEADDFLAAKDTFEMLLRLDRHDHFHIAKRPWVA